MTEFNDNWGTSNIRPVFMHIIKRNISFDHACFQIHLEIQEAMDIDDLENKIAWKTRWDIMQIISEE